MRDFKQYPGWAPLLLVVGVAVACQTLPITGRSQLQVLPESEEMRMGAQSYQDILTHPSEATRIRQIAAWMPEALTYYRPAR